MRLYLSLLLLLGQVLAVAPADLTQKEVDACKQVDKYTPPGTAAPLDLSKMTTIKDELSCINACNKNSGFQFSSSVTVADGKCVAALFAKSTTTGCWIFGTLPKLTTGATTDATYMDLAKCAKTTTTSTTTTTTSTTTSTSTSSSTTTTTTNGGQAFAALSPADKARVCCEWAKTGQCDSNPFFMRPSCPKHCGTPGCTAANALTCKTNVDTSDCGGSKASSNPATGAGSSSCVNAGGSKCPGWAAGGECNKNPMYMKTFCASSCSSCGATQASIEAPFKGPAGCTPNKAPRCVWWASTNECVKNPTWMGPNCGCACTSPGAAAAKTAYG